MFNNNQQSSYYRNGQRANNRPNSFWGHGHQPTDQTTQTAENNGQNLSNARVEPLSEQQRQYQAMQRQRYHQHRQQQQQPHIHNHSFSSRPPQQHSGRPNWSTTPSDPQLLTDADIVSYLQRREIMPVRSQSQRTVESAFFDSPFSAGFGAPNLQNSFSSLAPPSSFSQLLSSLTGSNAAGSNNVNSILEQMLFSNPSSSINVIDDSSEDNSIANIVSMQSTTIVPSTELFNQGGPIDLDILHEIVDPSAGAPPSKTTPLNLIESIPAYEYTIEPTTENPDATSETSAPKSPENTETPASEEQTDVDIPNIVEPTWSLNLEEKEEKNQCKIDCKTSNEQESEICSICLNDIEVGNQVKKLICQHIFHAECIDKWLSSHPVCPFCRAQVFSEEDIVTAQEQVSPPNNHNDTVAGTRQSTQRNNQNRDLFPEYSDVNYRTREAISFQFPPDPRNEPERAFAHQQSRRSQSTRDEMINLARQPWHMDGIVLGQPEISPVISREMLHIEGPNISNNHNNNNVSTVLSNREPTIRKPIKKPKPAVEKVDDEKNQTAFVNTPTGELIEGSIPVSTSEGSVIDFLSKSTLQQLEKNSKGAEQ